MLSSIRRVHEIIWERFRRKGSDLIYNYAEACGGDPTPEEIRAGIPNPSGWGLTIEDCCLNAGWLLDGMLEAHRVTGEAQWADKARRLFDGLASLGEVSHVPGFVARGYLPGRTEVYPNSSADQYTAFVYGLVAFARGPLATDADRSRARDRVVDVAKRLISNGECLPRLDGKPMIWGNTGRLSRDRGQRLLLFYKAAHALSQDEQWDRRYRNALFEFGGARQYANHGPAPHLPGGPVYEPFQSQAAWRALYELEADPVLRMRFRTAMRLTAQAVIGHIPRLSKWRDDPHPHDLCAWRKNWQRYATETGNPPPVTIRELSEYGTWVREHVPSTGAGGKSSAMGDLRSGLDALGVCLFCLEKDVRALAAEAARPYLEALAVEHIHIVTPLAGLEGAYWRGVASGLFE